MSFLKKRTRKNRKNLWGIKRRTVRRKPKIDLATQNLLRPKYQKKVNLFIYYCSLFIFVSGLVYLFLFSPLFIVNEINITAPENIPQQQIELFIWERTKGKYLEFISGRHFLFFRKNDLEREILNQHKNIEEIELKKEFPGKLLVNIKKKETQVVICNAKGCFFLDKEGKAVTKGTEADLFFYKEIIEVVRDESNSSLEIGEGISTLEYLNFVRNIKEDFKEKIGVEVKGIFSPLPSASEIKIKTSEGWLALLETKESRANQLGALKVILEQEIKPEDRICLEYVDLRISNKIYYKMVDDCEALKREQREKQLLQKNLEKK